MKKFEFTIRGNSYSVKVKSLEDSIAMLEVNGSEYEVKLQKEIKTTKTPKLVRSAPPPTAPKSLAPATALSHVVSPLPGVITKVLVKEGDTVKVGDNLLMLEAMKMENNILAEKAGQIVNVKVKEGESVMQGDKLMEIQ